MKIYISIILLISSLSAVVFSQTSLDNKYRLAKTYEQNGKLQDAKAIYEDIVTANPRNNQYSNSLNDVYIKLKEYDNSVSLLNKRILINPNDVSLYGMIGSTYYLMGNHKKASEYWEKGINVNKNSLISYNIISNYAIQNRAFENAIRYLEQGKAIAKNSTQFSYQLAQLYAVSMNYSKAADEYCQVLLSRPKQLDYVKNRMLSYLSSPGAAEQSVRTAEKYKDNLLVQELLVFLYIENDQFGKAYELVLDLDKEQDKKGLLIYNFANEAYQREKYFTASEAYKFVINNYNEYPYAVNSQIGYAKTLESELNNQFGSEQSWKPIKSVDTVNSFKYIPVLEAYKDILSRINNNEAATELQYRIGVLKLNIFNDLDGATELFLRIVEYSSTSQFYGISNLKLADICILQGNLEKAQNYLINSFSTTNLSEDTKSEAKYKLAVIYFWNLEFDQSLNTLNDISKDLSNNVSNDAIQLSMLISMGRRDSLKLAEFAQADMLTSQKKFNAAEDILKRLSSEDDFFILNNISQYKQAEVQIAQNNYPTAIEILKQLSEKKKLNIFTDQSLFLLAQVYEYGIADKESAISAYEDILTLHPNSIYFDKARRAIMRLNK